MVTKYQKFGDGYKPGSTDALSGLSVFKQVSALIDAVNDCTW